MRRTISYRANVPTTEKASTTITVWCSHVCGGMGTTKPNRSGTSSRVTMRVIPAVRLTLRVQAALPGAVALSGTHRL
jgi:hypothetical protein